MSSCQYFCLSCQMLVARSPKDRTCPLCHRYFVDLFDISENLVPNGGGKVIDSVKLYCIFCEELILKFPSDVHCPKCNFTFFSPFELTEILHLLRDSVQINGFNRVDVTKEEASEKCVIRWERFLLGKKLVRLGCKHYFHPLCMIQWLNKNGHCPLCRSEIL